MTSIEMTAVQLREQRATIKAGTLRIWGEWFGRPDDNIHQLKRVSISAKCMILHFDANETLEIESPSDVSVAAGRLTIGDAARIRWSWNYDDGPNPRRNRYYLEYKKEGGQLERFCNFPDDEPPIDNARHPAAELV